ncbi:MAG: SDR family NAD(P)-dependent oxidoreductase [Parasphingopyxis sp.]|uniref:SDR family NAD(P)-dependent oxidoreductase n=1 Tax=Parasphingopyxis sp. TaxID=1920299 RepID=UPI0032EBB4AE
MTPRPLAVVTGASTGIGYELAKYCADDGYDVIICANEPEIKDAAADLGRETVDAEILPIQADLGTKEGIETLWRALDARPIDALLANAGRGLGEAFLDQDFERAKDVLDVNVTGTISLIHKVGRQMRERGEGRILITGSVAGHMPGSFQAVYNGTKAFLDSFSYALRNELKDSGVTVTCLMPGPTDTEFFERAEMERTPVGQDDDKADPASVARKGYEAMKKGEAGVVTGFMNKVQTLFADLLPDTTVAQMHRRLAEPGRE